MRLNRASAISYKILKDDRIAFVLLTLLFRILIDISFKEIVAPIFSYVGFRNRETIFLTVVSYVLFFVYLFFSYGWFKNKDSIAKEVLFILFLLSVVPFTTMVRFGNLTTQFIVANSIFWLCMCLYLKCVPKRRTMKWSIKIANYKPTQKFEDELLKGILVVSFLVIVYISARYTGFRINLNLSNVYDLRSEAKMYNLPTWLRYLFGWSRAVNTVLIAYYIRRKKYLLSTIAFMLQILSFGIDGSKSVFFYAICALIINLFPRINLKRINRYALFGLSLISALGIVHYKLTGNYFITSLFVRRLLVLPVQLGQNYFTFFTEHTPDFYRGSFLKYFGFKTPYPDLVYLIGEVFYNGGTMGMNNGLIADAITNMSYLGVVIEPLFIIVFLKALDKSSKGLDVRIYITTALYMSIVLQNSFLPVVLLTHGGLGLIILLKMMKRERKPGEVQEA